MTNLLPVRKLVQPRVLEEDFLFPLEYGMAMHQKRNHVSAWGDDIKQHNRWQICHETDL